jgi:nitric oxide reductase
VQIAFLLLVAGNATMVNMINLGVVTLLQYPEQLADLKADPGLAPAFVEELCRYYTASALATRRVAKVDVVIGGQVSCPNSLHSNPNLNNAPRPTLEIARLLN